MTIGTSGAASRTRRAEASPDESGSDRSSVTTSATPRLSASTAAERRVTCVIWKAPGAASVSDSSSNRAFNRFYGTVLIQHACHIHRIGDNYAAKLELIAKQISQDLLRQRSWNTR